MDNHDTTSVFVLFGILFVAVLIDINAVEAVRRENRNSKKKAVPTFKIEYAWLSEHDGGYIAHFKLPVHTEVPSWTMALLFPERVYNITLWQATFLELTRDGKIVYAKQTQWNGHQWPGNVIDQRLLLRFNITPGLDYNGYSGPKPDIVFLDKVFLPKRDVDYEHEMDVVNYTFYSKPRSIYFRKPSLVTVPVTTTEPTTTMAPTTTQFNPFVNSGQEREYESLIGGGNWWYISGNKSTPNPLTSKTTAPTTTTRPGNWWQFAHLTSTAPPKPTLAAVDCTASAIQRTEACKRKRRPMRRCFRPQCEGERFKALQCWKAARKCWCVDVRSGVRAGEMVKHKNSERLNCYKRDESRTTPLPPTTPSIVLTTTPAYIPGNFSSSDGRPTFAPRNSYDYAQVIHNSHLFFEAQRSGTLPRNGRVSWRRSAHTLDGSECGKDLVGGYYQSGDYIKFGLPSAFSMTQLAWSYLEAKDAYQASWQTNFLKDTLKWATDYFIKAHTGQYEFYGQVGEPIYENGKWTRPQDMGDVTRPCYAITSRSPGSDLAAETAAALASTAAVWIESGSPKEDIYVQLLLKHARELFEFADKFKGLYHMSIRAAANYYPSSGYEDELAWAAMWLYIATGEQHFLANAKTKYFKFRLFSQDTEFSWDRKAVGVQLLLAKYTNKRTYLKPVIEFCDSVLPDGTTQYTPYGLLYISKWGSIRYACNAGFICMTASKLNMLSGEKRLKYKKFGEDQIDYVLGKTGKSFVIGFGTNYPTQPNHRASSCSQAGLCSLENFKSPTDNPQVLIGAVVGGPDEKDMWMNDRTNSMTNAVSLDFNSALQSAVAILRQFQIEYKAWFDSQWRQKKLMLQRT